MATLDCDGESTDYHLQLTSGETTQAKAVVIASGARYRRLEVANLDQFEGSSVHYWTRSSRPSCARARRCWAGRR